MTLPADSLTAAEQAEIDRVAMYACGCSVTRESGIWHEVAKLYAAGKRAARAPTIEECARAAEALASDFNMGRLFTRDPATACEDCAATLRALASADPPT